MDAVRGGWDGLVVERKDVIGFFVNSIGVDLLGEGDGGAERILGVEIPESHCWLT